MLRTFLGGTKKTHSVNRFFADTGSAVKSELYIRLERLTKVNLFYEVQLKLDIGLFKQFVLNY